MTDVTITPTKFGIGGNSAGKSLYYVEGTKDAQNAKFIIAGVTSIDANSVFLKEDGTPTALETVTVSTNEITLTSANTGTVSGYFIAEGI